MTIWLKSHMVLMIPTITVKGGKDIDPSERAQAQAFVSQLRADLRTVALYTPMGYMIVGSAKALLESKVNEVKQRIQEYNKGLTICKVVEAITLIDIRCQEHAP